MKQLRKVLVAWSAVAVCVGLSGVSIQGDDTDDSSAPEEGSRLQRQSRKSLRPSRASIGVGQGAVRRSPVVHYDTLEVVTKARRRVRKESHQVVAKSLRNDPDFLVKFVFDIVGELPRLQELKDTLYVMLLLWNSRTATYRGGSEDPVITLHWLGRDGSYAYNCDLSRLASRFLEADPITFLQLCSELCELECNPTKFHKHAIPRLASIAFGLHGGVAEDEIGRLFLQHGAPTKKHVQLQLLQVLTCFARNVSDDVIALIQEEQQMSWEDACRSLNDLCKAKTLAAFKARSHFPLNLDQQEVDVLQAGLKNAVALGDELWIRVVTEGRLEWLRDKRLLTLMAYAKAARSLEKKLAACQAAQPLKPEKFGGSQMELSRRTDDVRQSAKQLYADELAFAERANYSAGECEATDRGFRSA